jgi:hypothetical protein
MKRAWVFAAPLILLLAFAQPVISGELPKEGSFSYKSFAHGAYTAIAMGEERLQFNYEVYGLILNDAGEGFLHLASTHGLGSFHMVKGVYAEPWDRGFHVAVDPDGDKVFLTHIAKGGFGGAKAVFNFVGGTGKYTGITGGGEWTWVAGRPAAENTFQGCALCKGHYKLP